MAHAITDKISCTDTYLYVDTIHFKYIWAGRRDLIVTYICSLGCFSRYYNIKHISLHAYVHRCTDMVYSKALERDVYNYRDGVSDTAPENFGIYSVIEHDQVDFFTPKDE